MKQTIKVLLSFLLLSLSACTFHSDTPHKPEAASTAVKQKPVTNPSANNPPAPSENPLQTIRAQAEKGMVQNASVNVSHPFSDVTDRWGSPDHTDTVNGIHYANYSRHNITYGYTDSHLIVDVRSYAPYLKSITSSGIQGSLGKPDEIHQAGQQSIYVYNMDNTAQLRFILNTDGRVDHLSLYCPQLVTAQSDPYVLPIKGNSNRLARKAWNNMLAWRQQADNFARKNSDVFVNGPNVKKVALTFDDGPDLINTPAVITILKKYHVQGNFFFIGNRVEKYPSVVKSAYQNGNLVLNHSYKHDDLSLLSLMNIQKDVKHTEDAIYQAIGKRPALLRPPYGETDGEVIPAAENSGYNIVLWSIDTLDWSQREHANIVKNVLSNVRNGDIILMHCDEDKTETVKALPIIIQELQKQHFDIVNLADLLHVKAYK